MKSIFLAIAFVFSVFCIDAQDGAVGELTEIKKTSNQAWQSGQYFDRFTVKDVDYLFKRNYRGGDNQFGVFDGGTLYKIAKDGSQTVVRNYDLKGKISCYTSSAQSTSMIYGFKLDYFNNSYYLFYFTPKAELMGLDIVSGKSTLITDLKFNSQEILNSKFSISSDKSKLAIGWVTYNKKNLAVFDANLKQVLRYDRFQIPGASLVTYIGDIYIYKDGSALMLMGGGTNALDGGDVISGCYATKAKNEVFESFKEERKEYKINYHTIAEFNDKIFIMTGCTNKTTKKPYITLVEVLPTNLQNLRYSFQKVDISLDYPFLKVKENPQFVSYKTIATKDVLIYVTYKGQKEGFGQTANMYDYNLQFFVFDKNMKLLRSDELFYTAVDTRNKMKQEFPQELLFKLENGDLAIVYNDAVNHLENKQITDFADFSYISDRKKFNRESACYAATYNPTDGTIKKQLLLVSDNKSNLLNRFYPKASVVSGFLPNVW
jgi:hypothetical protein